WVAKARHVETLGYAVLTVPDHLADFFAPLPALVSAAEATTHLRVGPNGSCTSPLRIIPSAQKPGTMPHLTTLWRGQGHGLASFLLPTRSVGDHMALRHVASHWVQARP